MERATRWCKPERDRDNCTEQLPPPSSRLTQPPQPGDTNPTIIISSCDRDNHYQQLPHIATKDMIPIG